MNIIGDLGILTTHDTCDTDSLLCITDHKDILIKCSFLTVESNELLAVFSSLNNDLAACNLIQIKRMHGLAVFFHDIVCYINNIIDRTDTACCKPLSHPLGAGTELDILYHSCAVSGTKIGILYFNFDDIIDIFRIAALFNNRRIERLIESCRNFSGDTDNGITVNSVGCYLILKNSIMKSKCFNGIISGLHFILIKDIDTVFGCFGIEISI
ncbi:MAG: hypothetical protein BWY61_01574 [Firmicutes bacterium ADurb.Bin354]|nr:MAG: hypothetical protein BWY61_01574 [Firmicutes bacterium ADurb.Bin354]